MRELIEKINEATYEYNAGHPIMSDAEWDRLFETLKNMEKERGIIYPDSPTASFPYVYMEALQKVKHNHPMLSLKKIYDDIEELENFSKTAPCIFMPKMDGLTCSLLYQGGQLIRAETRGDGYEGEDVTENAKRVKNIPLQIPYKDELIVDGEVICKWDDFQPFKEKYSHPRNFAAGSIRLLDTEESEGRNLSFVAWEVIKPERRTLHDALRFIYSIGFEVVPYTYVELNSEKAINYCKNHAKELGYPIDGVVCKYDSRAFYNELGSTAHHPNGAVAYKFYNEDYETKLLDIEWTMGRTGTLTPVAIFEPVEIDGANISRASLHNVAIMKELFGEAGPKVNQTIFIYRANEIIPQVRNVDNDSGEAPIKMIEKCPYCGGTISLKHGDTSDELVCDNPGCSCKLINRLDHMLGVKGLNAKGLSKAILEKLINYGWIETPIDVFKLEAHRSEWINKPGFGPKSVDKIIRAIKESTTTSLEAFIASLGIPLIGLNVAKELVKVIPTYEELREKVKKGYDFSKIYSFGLQKSLNLLHFDYTMADEIYNNYITIEKEMPIETSNELSNLNVAITGKLVVCKNRAELEDKITARGGHISKSITSKTTLLINNDVDSTSTKNKAAHEKGIPIMSEVDFIKKYLK